MALIDLKGVGLDFPIYDSRARSFKQAITDQLQDLEDAYLARKVVARVASGKERVLELAEVERALALED